MHQQKSKKIIIYLFLFIIIGSLNNKNLMNFKFTKINEISIEGLDEISTQKLIKNLNFLQLNNLFFLKKKELTEIIDSNKLVETYSVYKNYPSTLNIKIDKAIFLAQVKKDNKIYLLGSNGKLTKKNDKKLDVPYIFGDFKNKNFFELKNMIDESYFDYNEIQNLFFFKSGRWDIETKNGLIIKLPSIEIKKSFDILNKILSDNSNKKIKKIDLRQKNQIIINE